MGKKFMMLKFRSMRVNSLSNKGWTTDTDSRKTKFGNFIRKTSIDELPQLFNVLRGDMSLVGPRPEIPVFVDQFKETIPLYMIKHYVKPGLTGQALIKGLRGDTSVDERIQADITEGAQNCVIQIVGASQPYSSFSIAALSTRANASSLESLLILSSYFPTSFGEGNALPI